MATAKPKTKSAALMVTKTSATSIVSIKDALAKQVASLAGRTAPPGGDAISCTQDKMFKLPDGTKTPGPLELVIVDFISTNTFYEGAYDPNQISPPACFAIGENPTVMTPSDKSPVKQSSSCSTCPMNQWGSDGKGKACKNGRMLAVLPPDADETTPLWILKVSPTAIKGFDSFVTSVARQFQLPPIGVIATVGFNPNETYAQLTFSDPKPNGLVTDMFGRMEEAKTRLTTEPDVSGYEAPKAKQVARRK